MNMAKSNTPFSQRHTAFHSAALIAADLAAPNFKVDDKRDEKKRQMIKTRIRHGSRSPVSPLQIGSLIDETISFRSSSFSSEGSSAPIQRRCISSPVISYPGAASSAYSHGDQHECPPFPFCQVSGLPALLHTQQRLRACMNRAQHFQKAIRVFESNLHTMSSRLPALVVAFVPLYSDCKDAEKVGDFIHQTTGPALAVLESFDTVRELASAIDCGPVEGNDRRYLQHISSLENALAFLRGNSSRVVQLLHRAVETLGSNKVVDQLTFHKLKETLTALRASQARQDPLKFGEELHDRAMKRLEARFGMILTDEKLIIHMPQSGVPATESEFKPPCSLETCSTLDVLQEVATKLSSQGRFKNCLDIYKKARTAAVKASLQTLPPDSLHYLQSSTPEAVNKLEWEALEEQIATWTKQMEAVVKILLRWELNLIRQVFSTVEEERGQGEVWKCFRKLAMKPALQRWLKFGEAVARSREKPQKLFKLLDMFESVEILRPALEEILSGEVCEPVRRRVYEMQDEAAKVACKVLSAFRVQVSSDMQGAAPADGGVLKLTSYVINYVHCLLSESYKPIMAQVLQREQKWRAAAEKAGALQLRVAILQLMQTLEGTVEYKADALQSPALGQLFLMNNHWYIYMRAKNSELAKLLGEAWHKQHKQRAEKCAERYRRELWEPLMSNLTEGVLLSGNDILLQQRMESFEAGFAEVHRRHKNWRVPDPVLRQQLGMAVIECVVPPLTAFLRRFAFLLPNPNQFRYPPQRIHSMLSALFQLPASHQNV